MDLSRGDETRLNIKYINSKLIVVKVGITTGASAAAAAGVAMLAGLSVYAFGAGLAVGVFAFFSVSLIGQQVQNDRVASAQLGSVTLTAGKEAIITFDGGRLKC